MDVLAALGDAPTAAIAVVAIVLGVLLAARGPRDRRATGAAEEEPQSAPTLLKVPVSPAADTAVEPGFVGPQGEVVGHGPIRLGAAGPLSGGTPAAAPAPPPAPEPAPAAPEPPLFQSPTPAASDPPPSPEEPAEAEEPAWRAAAHTATSAVHFRQGPIKLGGKRVDKDP